VSQGCQQQHRSEALHKVSAAQQLCCVSIAPSRDQTGASWRQCRSPNPSQVTQGHALARYAARTFARICAACPAPPGWQAPQAAREHVQKAVAPPALEPRCWLSHFHISKRLRSGSLNLHGHSRVRDLAPKDAEMRHSHTSRALTAERYANKRRRTCSPGPGSPPRTPCSACSTAGSVGVWMTSPGGSCS
jgi:hypothetical protein